LKQGNNSVLILKGSQDLYASMEILGSNQQNWLKLIEIRFIGKSLSLEDLNILYNTADVYISAGHLEGFDVPIVEALACDIPVITHHHSPNSHLASATFQTPQKLARLMGELIVNNKSVEHLEYAILTKQLIDLFGITNLLQSS
jgi:hypothetical protein